MAFDDLSAGQYGLLSRLFEAHNSGQYSSEFYAASSAEKGWVIQLKGVDGQDDKELGGFTEADLIALETNRYLTPELKPSGHALSLSHKAFEQLYLSQQALRLKSSTEKPEPINPASSQPPSAVEAKPTANPAYAGELYEEVRDLIQNTKQLDEETARLIIEKSDDAIKEFGSTNQKKRVELKRWKSQAELAIPAGNFEEFRKRAEGLWLRLLSPKNSRLRVFLLLAFGLIVIALGVLVVWRTFLWQSDKPKTAPPLAPSTATSPETPPRALQIEIKRPVQDEWIDVIADPDGSGAGYSSEVSGISKSPDPSNNVYVFVHPVNPHGSGWWRQHTPIDKQHENGWQARMVWFGDKDHPVAHGQSFDIQAVAGGSEVLTKVRPNDSYISDEDFERIEAEKKSQKIRVHIRFVNHSGYTQWVSYGALTLSIIALLLFVLRLTRSPKARPG
jgi:hypothetical protein